MAALPDSVTIFLWGIAGSVSVEIIQAYYYYTKEGAFPGYYSKPGFWFVRSLLALIGGALAIGYDIKNGIAAFQIGASAPLIVQNLSRPPDDKSDNDNDDDTTGTS